MTINNNKYTDKPVTYKFVRILKKNGIKLEEFGDDPFELLSQYVAYCMDKSVDAADDELDAHFENGGDVKEILDVINSKIEESGFFQALKQTTDKKPTQK